MEITLIRHGESTGNTLGMYQGWGDFGLTELGRAQAQITGERLADTRYDRILISDTDRAVETAEILFPKDKYRIERRRSLRSLDCGDLCGLTEQQALDNFGDISNRGRFDFTPFHGEDHTAMVDRVHGLMGELAEGSDHRIAIITHGGPIRAMLFYILDIDFVAHFRLFDLRNCGVSQIRYRDGAWRILYVNDCSHLREGRIPVKPSIPSVDGL